VVPIFHTSVGVVDDMWWYLSLLYLASLVSIVSSYEDANVQTECNQQLHNYFVAEGMPLATPLIQALNFTSGVYLGTPFVKIQFGLQAAARAYGHLLPNTTLADDIFIRWFSNNNPWCASNIVWECVDSLAIGTIKTTNCTTIIDTDPGGTDPVAGRYFMYANESAACVNGPVVTIYNVSIIPMETDVYTYDALGIRDHTDTIPATAARNIYRSSYCDYSDGAPVDIAIQNQFVCIEPRVGCPGTRSNGVGTIQPLPIPQFRCIGPITPNSTTPFVVWDVTNFQNTQGVEGVYYIQFEANTNLGNPPTPIPSIGYHIIIPNERGQFNSGFSTLDHVAYLYYGQWNSFRPTYPLSNDPIIAAVPCDCDFSVNCLPNGEIDFEDQTMTILLSNIQPICIAGIPIEIPLGSPNVTLDASGSYDPDLLPFPFTTYWVILATPYDPSPPPFTLGDPRATTIYINFTNLISGNYAFLLYASDLQSQVPCVFNVTVLGNEMFPIVQDDAIVLFNFYGGNIAGHDCSIYPPSPAISVNGSYSYNTQPNITMYFIWIQISGAPLQYNCDPLGFRNTQAFFNTTESIVWFVPPTVGMYGFQLIVTDGITNVSSRYVYINVIPNFGQPNATLTPVPNATDPPTRLDSQSPVGDWPTFSFTLPPAVPLAPVPQPPPPNTTVPPIITILPEPTPTTIIAIFVSVMGLVFMSFLSMVLWKRYSHVNAYRHLDKITYGGVQT
jgi:hypothetical protein